MKPLNAKDIKRLNETLNNQFDLKEKITGVFLFGADDKIYLSTHAIENVPLSNIRIDSIGLYFGTWMRDGFRMSIEGAQIVAEKAKKGKMELTREEWEAWLKGQDIETSQPDGYYLIMYDRNCYGCGKVSKGRLLNYVAKARRLSVINA